MMQFDRMYLGRQARELGYVRDTFEKVCRLTDILDTFRNDSMLSEKLALKGGTAINLTIFDLPRLSVDIDLDFIENLSREEMMAMRDQITSRIGKYMASANYCLSPRSKYYHALDSLIYDYKNAGGMKDNIKIEINYMNRCHILPMVERKVRLSWMDKDLRVLSLNPLEIFGSKIVALLNRATPRDLYDVNSMFQHELFDDSQYPLLKKCVMFYSAIGSATVPEQFDFNNISAISRQRIKTDLIPVLRKGEQFDVKMAQDAVNAEMKEILIPTDKELLFWAAFRNKHYQPELLFDDADILKRIQAHPMALWKCSDKMRNAN